MPICMARQNTDNLWLISDLCVWVLGILCRLVKHFNSIYRPDVYSILTSLQPDYDTSLEEYVEPISLCWKLVFCSELSYRIPMLVQEAH